LIEAMAHVVPVIASTASGNPEVVRDGETGILVAPDDAPALASAVERMLHDTEFAARMAAAAAESVRAQWNAPDMLHDLECLLYAHLIARRDAGRSRAALFVDRDGTLVRDVPYNADPAAVDLEPQVGRALRWVRDAGMPIVVVSNQSAVARGLCTEDSVHAVNERIRDDLRARGAEVEAVYFCPHHPDHGPPCDCRKPEPGLLQRAAREHHLDLSRSVTVGDSPRDLEAGRRAGTRTLAYRNARAPGEETVVPASESDWGRGAPRAPGSTAVQARDSTRSRGDGDDADRFETGTFVYGDWMALVRDLLRGIWTGSIP
jgi:histidinol-phosphate phosphatase family protein